MSINADLMSWVLENLVKNSIDAIRGKGEITIELSWDKTALIYIRDSGSGIPKKLQGKVFEAGVTTKKTRVGSWACSSNTYYNTISRWKIKAD